MTHEITVKADGTVQFIWSDELRPLLELGTGTVTRASHVEPTADCRWEADLSPVGGPTLGPFDERGEALRAEIEWLRNHGF